MVTAGVGEIVGGDTSVVIDLDGILAGILTGGGGAYFAVNGSSNIGEKASGRGEYVHRTNADARRMADEMGYTQVGGENKARELIFKKGNKYISLDDTSHNGGVWKMANSVKDLNDKTRRLGTYNADLTVRIGD